MSEIQRESTAGPGSGPALDKSRTCLPKAELLFTKVPICDVTVLQTTFPTSLCDGVAGVLGELYYKMVLDFCIDVCHLVSVT